MPIRTLAEAISHYGREAYLLTVAKDGPHTSHVTIELRGGSIGCAVGASAAKNIAREPNVSLFWPPTEPRRLCLDRQWRGRGRASGDGRDDGRDHTHEIRAASCGPQARRQRRAVCGRLPPPDAVTRRLLSVCTPPRTVARSEAIIIRRSNLTAHVTENSSPVQTNNVRIRASPPRRQPRRHCEPTGRANARPMTGSAKQSISPCRKCGLLHRFRSSQ